MFRIFTFHWQALAVSLALLPCTGCGPKPPPASSAAVALPAAEIRPPDNSAPWGANCNEALLAGEFALNKATAFTVTETEQARIDEVVKEVKGGYGGTVVTAPRPDAVLDSPAFLAHYLRAFAKPETMTWYDYHFERIQERLSSAEYVLDDPRLDWDIWRAFLLFEDAVASGTDANQYQTESGGVSLINCLDGAKDLLWWYLTHNSDRIREDKARLAWWIDQLTTGMRAPGGRPMRRWYLLQLVASTDTKTEALLRKDSPTDHSEIFSLRSSDPFHPFLVIEGMFADDQKPQPTFLKTIQNIAHSQKLSFTLWDIDPAAMPPTKAVQTDLAPRLSQFAPALVLSQESWSKKPQEFEVGFCRPIGRRSSHLNVRFPSTDNTDGVFFFTYNARLYIWPKARLDDAAIQMLQVSGLIDGERYDEFVVKGFTRLKTTRTNDQ